MNLLEQLFKRLDKIEAKIDIIDSRVDNIDVTLVKQHAELVEHTRRSTANERAVELLTDQFKPINKHVIFVETIMKILGLITLLTGVIIGLVDVLGRLS